MKLSKALTIPRRLARLSAFSALWSGDLVVRGIKNAARPGKSGNVLDVPTLDLDGEAQLEQAMREGRPFIVPHADRKWTSCQDITPESMKAWPDLINVYLSGEHETFLGGRTEPRIWMTARELVERVFEGRLTAGRLYLRDREEWKLAGDDIRENIGCYRLSHAGTVLFVGPAGTVTRLHFDHVHGLLTQISGRKKVVLFAPSQAFNIYEDVLGPTRRDQCSWLPELDCMQADPGKFKRFWKADRYEAVLMPGSVMHIPPFWWHEVTSLDPGISIGARYDCDGPEPLRTRWIRWSRSLPIEIQGVAVRRRMIPEPTQYRSSELSEGTDPAYQLDPR